MFTSRQNLSGVHTACDDVRLKFPRANQHPELMEGVQHRATRMVPGLAKLPYEDRLRKMDLPCRNLITEKVEEMQSKFISMYTEFTMFTALDYFYCMNQPVC